MLETSGLCGDAEGLIPCSGKKKHSRTTLLAVLIPVCGLLVLLATIVARLLIRYRNTKFLVEENKTILECEEKVESLIWGREGKFTFRDIVKAGH